MTPEAAARANIDRALVDAGWVVQDLDAMNIAAARGVAVRELPLKPGHGFADYLLYVDGQVVGVIEAKKEGTPLTGVELQTAKYSDGLPEGVPAPVRPIPFLYQSTGVETRFTNRLDPRPKSREVFTFHRPETLAEWIAEEPLWMPMVDGKLHPLSQRPASLRARLTAMPGVPETNLWPAQLDAVRNLEVSLAKDKPRALIQMATGSGKTFTAVTSIYRLIKFADARRVLFLVDRANLGRQALKEFQSYRTPDDGRLFTELYNVQLLTSNRIDPVARVVIGTIQRLYSMLKGEDVMDPDADETSAGGLEGLYKEPLPVVYNPKIPIEHFDVVFVDECHRSIYTLWRQVLEYFDSFLVGLTATPAKQTFGFFNQNLVMEYGHDAAVADGVNVDFDVYRIRTKITEQGSSVEAGQWVDKRDRETRAKRWEQLDEDLSYAATALDRDVVAPDQIRTVVRAFKEKFLPEVFPERTHVPKTLIYAKDDSHADDIVRIIRDEWGVGNDFVEKITYKTGTARIVEKVAGPDGTEIERVTYKSSGIRPEDLLSAFRNSYYPRVAVTVDMIATGTDIRPLEVVWFMRAVKSRNLFEQMKGRGVRIIGPDDLQTVTPDAAAKTRFVIVDCVGVCESPLSDTRPLDKKPTVSLEKLLQAVAMGNVDAEVISTLASRLARLDRQLGKDERAAVRDAAGGRSLTEITHGLVDALDPDRQIEVARRANGLAPSAQPTEAQRSKAAAELARAAAAPLVSNPHLRQRLVDLKKSKEQVIDTVSQDTLLGAGLSAEARERAKELTRSFEQFLEEHRDEITALQLLYGSKDGKRLTREAIEELANAIQAPPRRWTPEELWRAYEVLDKSKVRGSPGKVLTNLVSLVRFALHREGELKPFPEVARERFEAWMTQQEARGRTFTTVQRHWLEAIRDHVAANLEMTLEDFEYPPFSQRGGLAAVYRLFGRELSPMLAELTSTIAA